MMGDLRCSLVKLAYIHLESIFLLVRPSPLPAAYPALLATISISEQS